MLSQVENTTIYGTISLLKQELNTIEMLELYGLVIHTWGEGININEKQLRGSVITYYKFQRTISK